MSFETYIGIVATVACIASIGRLVIAWKTWTSLREGGPDADS